MALQLALDAPQRVRSLVLLEPSVLVEPAAAQFRATLAPVVTRYLAGDVEAAMAAFWDAVGPGWRGLDVGGPGFLAQAVAGASAMFGSDLPSLREWEFGPEQAARVRGPVHYVLGSDTLPLYRENLTLLRAWLPRLQPVEVAGANHLLPIQQPARIAELVAAAAQTRA